MAKHSIGSVWRKWDLHVHTPSSAVQGYGGDSDEVWEKFVSDLEDLPPEFAVIGVNDYLFLDGYRRLLRMKEEGRLKNIETLLPVVEFRLAKFAGHDKMLRLNFHLIFSETLTPDTIENQFLVQLRAGLNVSAEHASVRKQWNAAVTHDSLEDLGRLIREDMPPEHAEALHESDYLLGFNNLNFDDRKLFDMMDNSYLRGKYVAAVGKAEWDQYRWNDHSIAEKKNVINSVHAVFTAAADVAAFDRGRARLLQENVNDHLFDCSDAHAFSDSPDKDRIGNCSTWVKGDTTLDGLILAIKDYPERVYVGPRPPVLEDIDRHPAKFIRRVQIGKRPDCSPNGKWFDGVDLPLNPELVAVIGNRGMGKSALLDSIALAGNAPRPSKDMSFLQPFQAARGNLADSFAVTLDWYTPEAGSAVPLSSTYDETSPSRVKHLPQHFIDVLCNEEQGRFEQEIERVVFSHVEEDERLGCHSLSDLIEYRSQTLQQPADQLKEDISELNRKIAALEDQMAPNHVLRLEEELSQKIEELRGMLQNRPVVPKAPQSADPVVDERIKQLRQTVAALAQKKTGIEESIVKVRAAVEASRRVSATVEALEKHVTKVAAESADDLAKVGLSFTDIVTLDVKREVISRKEQELRTELTGLRESIDSEHDGSVAAQLEAAKKELKDAESALSAPLQAYKAAMDSRHEFTASLHALIGDVDSPETIRYTKSQLAYVRDKAPSMLRDLERERLEKTKDLFSLLAKHVTLLEELYAPVQRFVDRHPPADDAFRVTFSASLEAMDFEEGFSSYVAHNKRGSFYGAEQAHVRIEGLLRDADFNNWPSVETFLDAVSSALHCDLRSGENNAARQVAEQLRPRQTAAELYDFLFQLPYVRYRHHLTMGGRPLRDLSPGEKGALLLVFYLLIDQSECPLLIDQPEENLDNQSVFKVMVPFIREARKRRQVFLVTHNPNIAVVAAAEQVIFCAMDKHNGYRLSYVSGALENPEMNQHVLDVLEGTRPAFTNRDRTYEVSAEQKSP